MAKFLSSELKRSVTPKEVVFNRRRFIQAAGAASVAISFPSFSAVQQSPPNWLSTSVGSASLGQWAAKEPLTDFADATQYNNFYEFGDNKGDPARYGHEFNPYPWKIKVDGNCEQGGDFDFRALLSDVALEQRIYRLRCVEAWSMVIPWIGFPLAQLLERFRPTNDAKYVAFETIVRKEEMRGQRGLFSSIDWPYIEGLRIDEALHPLAFVAVGMYSDVLPVQNGAPIRLVVPWKYGFKSIKSVVRIHFTDKEPPTTWKQTNPREYGFYSNVNPDRNHPRWSQATERRFGPNGEIVRLPTELFNGYDEVASLYQGMDLKLFY